MKDLKVALCLSGEARTYDAAYPLFKKHIIDVLNPDIFISTWDSEFLMSNQNCMVVDYIGLFKPVKYEIEQLNRRNVVINKNVTDINELNNLLLSYLTQQNLDLFRGQKYLASMKHPAGIRAYAMVNMFYKNWRCFHLCCNHAEEMGRPYDLVIRSRPDIRFNQPLNTEKIEYLVKNKSSICVPCWAWEGLAIPDAFAYGSMEALYAYTNIYLRLEEYFYSKKVNMKPDFMLKEHLESQGIEILVDNMPHDCLRPEYNLTKGLWYPL